MNGIPEPDPGTASSPQNSPTNKSPDLWHRLRNLLPAQKAKQVRLYVEITGSILSIVIGLVTSGPRVWRWYHKLSAPNIELAFYDEGANGRKQITRENRLSATLSPRNMATSVVHLPIRLALKNAGSEDLRDVRVKIRYDPKVMVLSEALQKVLDGSIVYEQPLGRIDRQDEYVFLPKTDELLIKVFTAVEDKSS